MDMTLVLIEYIYSTGKIIGDKNLPHCKNFWISNNLGNLTNIGGSCLFTFTYKGPVPLERIAVAITSDYEIPAFLGICR